MEHTITVKGKGSLSNIINSLERTLKAVKGLRDADNKTGNGGVDASFNDNVTKTLIHKKR